MKRRFWSAVRRVAPALCASAGLAACVDFELLAPQQPPTPRLSMLITVGHDSVSAYDVAAYFFPGADAASASGAAGLSLTVNGQTFAPTHIGNLVEWRQKFTVARGQHDTLRIVLPQPGDTRSAATTMVIPVMYSDTSYRMRLLEGEALHLHVSPPPSSGDLAMAHAFWELDVGRGTCPNLDRGALQLQATYPNPADLVIPWALLVPIAGVQSACFSSSLSHEFHGAPYPVFVSEFVRIAWRIENSAAIASR